MSLHDVLRNRPRVGQLVVPYMVDATRDPIDFRELDAEHVARCATQRRCGICGERIKRPPFAFIGPEDRRRCFADPWMHPSCARLALEQCPFLAGRRDWRGSDAQADPLLKAYSAGMGLLLAPDCRSHRDHLGAWHFEAVGVSR